MGQREQNNADKRARILRAAEEMLPLLRPHEVKLDDVATAAGVGKGTIYLYFKDKEDLFLHLAMAGFEELCGMIRKEASANGEFPARLLAVCRKISGFFERRRALFRVMQADPPKSPAFTDSAYEQWMERRRDLVTAVADLMAGGQREGVLRRDVPPAVLANFFLGMLRTRARDMGEESETHRDHAFVIRLFAEGAGNGGRMKTREHFTTILETNQS